MQLLGSDVELKMEVDMTSKRISWYSDNKLLTSIEIPK